MFMMVFRVGELKPGNRNKNLSLNTSQPTFPVGFFMGILCKHARFFLIHQRGI